MAERSIAQSMKTSTSAPSLTSNSTLDRACSCGGQASREFGEPGGRGCDVVRRSAVGSGQVRLVPPLVHEVVRWPGQPLDADVRTSAEASLDADFSRVRVHTDAQAARSARMLNANAYTVGHGIVFGCQKYSPYSAAGRRLLLHELTHVVQQRSISAGGTPLLIGADDSRFEREAVRQETTRTAEPVVSTAAQSMLQRQPSQDQLMQVCERPGAVQDQGARGCTYRAPENCVTYEQWIAAFGALRHFTALDSVPGGTPSGHEVLGAAPASAEADAPEADRPVPPARGGVADRFIDHPTDQWVRTCLPENLRQTAYRLPSDCADIAVILRHVWLAAHRRTERVGRWIIGDAAGRAAQTRIAGIIGAVYSGNVDLIVNPYTDAQGNPLRSFDALQARLHPGDVLVWAHHAGDLGGPRTGGHTHTVVEVSRQAGRVAVLTALQGNQPISELQATEIREQLRTEQPRRAVPTESALRGAAGRRIEVDTLSVAGGDLRDLPLPQPRGAEHGQPRLVWTWRDGSTTLVAAGPPAAAAQPPGRRPGGRVRRLVDWLAPLRAANRETLPGTFEAALMEARSAVEAGTGQPTDQDAAQFGRVVGERLWQLARQSRDLGGESHFEPMERLRAVLRSLGGIEPSGRTDNPNADEVRRVFLLIEEAFDLAARGGTSIDFPSRTARGTTLVKVLLTGFDPFNVTDPRRSPAPGDWNPSGAAVLALDGKRLTAGSDAVVAVEGVVLPVDFVRFEQGLVEQIVGPLVNQVDAILTVSMDPGIVLGEPVRFERFAVGVHELNDGRLRDIPGVGGGSTGPAIIETGASLEDLRRATESPRRRGQVAVPAPDIGDAVTFEFATADEADRALGALNLSPQRNRLVEIRSLPALQQIGSTATRGPGETIVRFQAQGRAFQVRLLSGPGGNFLSNEVSYRVLRLIAAGQDARSPISFHIHTQRGDNVSREANAPADRRGRQRLLDRARNVRGTLIATLTRVIQAVAVRVVAARRPSGTRAPQRRRSRTGP